MLSFALFLVGVLGVLDVRGVRGTLCSEKVCEGVRTVRHFSKKNADLKQNSDLKQIDEQIDANSSWRLLNALGGPILYLAFF